MKECRYCGMIHGPKCPSIKAIEYHPDGTVKRIEFVTPADYFQNQPLPMPIVPPVWWPPQTTWSTNG